MIEKEVSPEKFKIYYEIGNPVVVFGEPDVSKDTIPPQRRITTCESNKTLESLGDIPGLTSFRIRKKRSEGNWRRWNRNPESRQGYVDALNTPSARDNKIKAAKKSWQDPEISESMRRGGKERAERHALECAVRAFGLLFEDILLRELANNSDNALAKKMGVSDKVVKRLRRRYDVSAPPRTWIKRGGEVKEKYASIIADLIASGREEEVLSQLSERERDVFARLNRNGREDNVPTLQELGERYKVSRETIRKVEMKIIKVVKKLLKANGINVALHF